MVRILFGYSLALGTFTLLADAGYMSVILDRVHEVPAGDKVVHFVLAGTFALLANLAIHARLATNWWVALIPGTLLAVIAVTLDECSNLLMESRGWSLADLAANYLGILCIGVVPMVFYFSVRNRADRAIRHAKIA